MAIVPLEQLPSFARLTLGRVQAKPNGAFLLFLSGPLGSGKTTFMQALAKELGIKGVVQSPTFVLMKKYPIDAAGFSRLIHIDAYRLDDPDEFSALMPEEFLTDPRALVCIEWAERVSSVLPPPDMTVALSSEGMGVGERRIE